MTDLSAHFPLVVDDEFPLLQLLAPSRGADILDVGCGAGAFTGRMAVEGGARRVAGIEVDDIQLGKNLAKTWPAGVEFHRTGAQALPFADASFDGATLFKSLHHIPTDLMGDAFREIHRVLRPGGWLYVSEPVYEGPYNEVMRLFHDEGAVRAAAIRATEAAQAAGLFRLQRRVRFMSGITYRDFDDYRKRSMTKTHSHISSDAALVETVRRAYEAHQTATGAHFSRPIRVELLVKG